MASLDAPSERLDPLVGEMLGKDYRVIEPIGFGGMAVVYLVEHQTLLKRFAAKVLSVELAANLEARARFTQEAHAASQLDHENIVNISDFGVTSDQRPFFVMELLRGQTLDQRVAEAPLSIEEVVAVGVPVARALAHAHAEGIVHRDVKPENIFLVQRSQGRFGVKVVDFGIAKTPINARLTKMGETLGSPMFMAPEACRGDDVDHRADIYSFGILLYLMLCGRVPFQDESLLKVLQMQVSEPLPPPRSVNPALSAELAAVLERTLAKDPDARYVSMDALLIDLEAAVPAGSDRLLIEAQAGVASSFRLTSLAPPPTRLARATSQPFASASQPFATVSQVLPTQTQPLPQQVSRALPAASAADVARATGDSAGLGPRGLEAVQGDSAPVDLRPARWRAGWMVAIAVPVLAGAVAVWFLVLRGDAGGRAAARAAAAETAAAAAPLAARPGPEREGAPSDDRERQIARDPDPAPEIPDGPGSAAVSTVRLRVVTTPAGALVELGGKRLGATPIDREVPRVEGDVRLVITRDGFVETSRQLDLREDQSLDVSLVASGRAPATVKRAPPARPPARPAAAAPARPTTPPARPPPPTPPASERRGDPNLDIRLSR